MLGIWTGGGGYDSKEHFWGGWSKDVARSTSEVRDMVSEKRFQGYAGVTWNSRGIDRPLQSTKIARIQHSDDCMYLF
jgi:hypothetical protein